MDEDAAWPPGVSNYSVSVVLHILERQIAVLVGPNRAGAAAPPGTTKSHAREQILAKRLGAGHPRTNQTAESA
eukprot:scaffold3234_cov166-Amphora_coffeaeformis.AAC.11